MVVPAIRLEMRGICKRFGGVVALDDVTLCVRSGEIHAIVGENGAGKSTLMKILSGAITDFTGQLVLNGRPVRFRGPRDAENQGVSIIYQELNLVPSLTAAANIFLGREMRIGPFLNDRAMRREAAAYFRQLGAPIDPGTPVRRLRVADRQLVEIAKALSLDADIVIMDEPTSALSEAEVSRLIRVIKSLQEHGVTVLYISHKMDEVFKLADRITVLRDGRHVRTLEHGETTPDEVIRLMVGRDVAALDLERSRGVGEELLRVEGLSLPHAERVNAWHLKDVKLALHSGEIVGIAGLLGAGRTELLECLFGAAPVRPTGRILIGARPCRIDSPRDAIAKGLALVTEDRKNLGLFAAMTTADNITVCHLSELRRGPFLSRQRQMQAARSQMDRLTIRAPGPQTPVLSLSGGNQQKCVLGRWLLTRPKILLLDEPTRGIDVAAKAEVYALLGALAHHGMGILMTSSELPELLALCDRIVVLCAGRKTAEFDRATATEELIMRAATGLEINADL
jgi:ABC-type sugar transport system ATPase subunit